MKDNWLLAGDSLPTKDIPVYYYCPIASVRYGKYLGDGTDNTFGGLRGFSADKVTHWQYAVSGDKVPVKPTTYEHEWICTSAAGLNSHSTYKCEKCGDDVKLIIDSSMDKNAIFNTECKTK